jgi:hypothetical protein
MWLVVTNISEEYAASPEEKLVLQYMASSTNFNNRNMRGVKPGYSAS